jgi:aryl-alcohol dehydrogenase-like predicted oxidoreductase
MSLNSFITLGRSGLRVSPFCLGSMTFGEDWGWGASVADSETMIAAYLERGGNFIDTASIYTNGHSEKIIGDFFAQKKGNRRDRVVIGTKFFCSLFEGDPNGGGAGRKARNAPKGNMDKSALRQSVIARTCFATARADAFAASAGFDLDFYSWCCGPG